MLKINLISDLHIDVNSSYTHPKVDADVLIIAGDLCKPSDERNITIEGENEYEKVVACNGNHDLWGFHAIKIEEFPFNNVYYKDNYVIISCTLWTDFWGEYLTLADMKQLNDFRYIEGLGVQRMKDFYKSDLKFIKDSVKKYKDKKVVVVTHFAPSKKAIAEQYEGARLNKYFVNDLDKFILKNDNIKLWCFGHTHSSLDFMIGQCRCVCNPKGYGDENPDFDPCKIISI